MALIGPDFLALPVNRRNIRCPERLKNFRLGGSAHFQIHLHVAMRQLAVSCRNRGRRSHASAKQSCKDYQCKRILHHVITFEFDRQFADGRFSARPMPNKFEGGIWSYAALLSPTCVTLCDRQFDLLALINLATERGLIRADIRATEKNVVQISF